MANWYALAAEACVLPHQHVTVADAPCQQMVLPDVVALQVSPETRYRWIDYSSLDAQATWLLRESLEFKLRNMPVEACKHLSANPHFKVCATMWDLYTQNWLPFGEILVDMERNGMLVDKEQLRVAETLATEHQKTSENAFRSWAIQRCEDARWMNVGSGAQVRCPGRLPTRQRTVIDALALHAHRSDSCSMPA